MITTFASDLVSVYRRTAKLLDGRVIADSLSLPRQPVRASILEVRIFHVDGSDSGSGTVTINGNVNGSPDSETLALDIDETKDSTKLFESVSSLAIAGFDVSPKPHIEIRALGRGGEVQPAIDDVVTGWPAQIDRTHPFWTGGAEGLDPRSKPTVLIDYAETWSPRIGDVVVDNDGIELIVRGVVLQRSGFAPRHWALSVDRRGDSV